MKNNVLHSFSCLYLFLLLCFCCGCIFSFERPDGAKWQQVKVEWLEQHEGSLTNCTWNTRSQQQLNVLQSAFKKCLIKLDGRTIAYVNKYNKITVTLDGGKQWVLHFCPNRCPPSDQERYSDAIAMNEVPKTSDGAFCSYRLDIKKDFQKVISSMIAETTKTQVDLLVDFGDPAVEREKMRALNEASELQKLKGVLQQMGLPGVNSEGTNSNNIRSIPHE